MVDEKMRCKLPKVIHDELVLPLAKESISLSLSTQDAEELALKMITEFRSKHHEFANSLKLIGIGNGRIGIGFRDRSTGIECVGLHRNTISRENFEFVIPKRICQGDIRFNHRSTRSRKVSLCDSRSDSHE